MPNYQANTPLEAMMSNIQAEGTVAVFNDIEKINDGLKRASARKLYHTAIKKLGNK